MPVRLKPQICGFDRIASKPTSLARVQALAFAQHVFGEGIHPVHPIALPIGDEMVGHRAHQNGIFGFGEMQLVLVDRSSRMTFITLPMPYSDRKTGFVPWPRVRRKRIVSAVRVPG